MKIKITTLVLLCLITELALGQELTQTIRGIVKDDFSKVPLIGVNVQVNKGDKKYIGQTDIDGNFRFENLPIGRYNIQLSSIGYEPKQLNQLELTSSKELVLNLELTEKVNTTKRITVTAKKKKGTKNSSVSVSGRTFSIEESQRYAGSKGDVARMAQNFAGVQGADDSRNDIIVRGNSPIGVLYRLEGVDIPNPNHYSAAGTTGGPISMLNNNVLTNSDFLSGAFPAEYGNANAAVFDLNFRKGNNEKTEFLGQIGFAGFEGMVEGPISKKKKSSFLVNYRYSALGVFALMGIDFGTGTAIPKYQDMSFNLFFPDNKGYFKIFGLGGISNIDLIQSENSAGDNLFGDNSEDLKYTTKTGVIGINRFQRLNKKTFLKLTVAVDAAQTITNLDTFSFDSFGNVRNFSGKYRENSYQGKYSFNALIQHKFNSRNTIKVGIRFYNNFFSLADSLYLWDKNVQTNQPLGWIQPTNFNGNTNLIQTFISHTHKLSNKTTFTVGLNNAFYIYNKSNSIEPRAGMTFKTSSKNRISFGYGLHSQLPPFRIYFEEFTDSFGNSRRANQDIGFVKSHHFVIANDYSFNSKTRLKVEVYYQSLFNVPIDEKEYEFYSLLNQGADFGVSFTDSLASKGTGKNFGVELTLERFLSKGFYYLATTSVYRSLYTDRYGNQHPTAFDSRYALNLLAGKEFFFKEKTKIKKDKSTKGSLTTDLKFVLNGGKRFTPYDEALSQANGKSEHDRNRIYEGKYPDYYRFDIRIAYKKQSKKSSQELGIDIQNVTNRMNVFSQSYDVETNTYSTTTQTGLFPLAFYRITF